MNNLDKRYTDLLQDILDNGTKKETRNGGTLSVFGRQIRHKMSDGFPLLTTKKMAWKSVVTELLWFLKGDTNIKFLIDNDCHIWDGDAYKNYVKFFDSLRYSNPTPLSQEEFVGKIKTDDEFAEEWGSLGPVYGKQWRSWAGKRLYTPHTKADESFIEIKIIDQIANLISELKTNPDSRRLLVSAWNPAELDQMVLPPCHYGFQVYTRELSQEERWRIRYNYYPKDKQFPWDRMALPPHDFLDKFNIPTRAISLMWNQRSCDFFLGAPFNIASYGLLLEIIAKAVNMVPDELIGNLGDVHLYSNHVEQAKEQIGRELSNEERNEWHLVNRCGGNKRDCKTDWKDFELDQQDVPKHTRNPYPLPTLNINTEFWPYEGGECGVGPLDAVKVFESFKDDNFCKCLLEEDIQLSNYQSHPSIKAPLSN